MRVRLNDGSEVIVRPVEPGDKELIREGFARLSERSRYQRFLAPVHELTPSQLRYLTEVDHHHHEALVAFDSAAGTGVGIGRFVRTDDPESAEAAITVVDAWQGRGLGTALCGLLAERARREGVRRFTALLLSQNRQMQEILATLGPSRVVSRDAGTVEVEVEIPAEGIGEPLAGLLRVAAGGMLELATPPLGYAALEDSGADPEAGSARPPSPGSAPS